MGVTAHQKLRVIWERLFPIDRWRDPETLRQAGRVVAFDLTMFFWVVIFAPIYALLGSMPSVIVLVMVGVVLPAALIALQRGLSPTLCGNILCWAGWLTYTALVYVQGGMAAPSPTLTWFASLPICAVYMCGLRSGIFWTVASILAVTGFAVADHLGFQCPNTLTPFAARLLQFLALAGLITCVFAARTRADAFRVECSPYTARNQLPARGAILARRPDRHRQSAQLRLDHGARVEAARAPPCPFRSR